MTQRKKAFLPFIFAAALVVESFAIWTLVMTGSMAMNFWVGAATIPSFANVVTEVVFKGTQSETVRHASAPETEEEEGIGGPEATVEVDPVRQELTQWGLREWVVLSIPAIDLRVPVYLPSRRFWDAKEWGVLEEQMQMGLLHGAAAYPHSVSPGRKGSLIIAGHSSPPDERAKASAYGTIFARLPELEAGDTISVLSNGVPVTYRVTGTIVVPSTATNILTQDPTQSVLKLITCFPIGTTKDRLLVTAHRI